jgi:uroporphyrin-III C-methyltransferase
LLTLRAVRALGQADVVLYDRLVDTRSLAHARPDAEIIYVGKHHGQQEHTQAEIFALIENRARSGKTIARLKGGDPLVFGRGAEEWALALASGIEVELIPGVSSAIAAPGLAGIPLTYRRISQNFAVITGHCHEGAALEWKRYAEIDTLVILMGVKNRSFIAQSLIAAGRSPEEPVAFIERGTTETENFVQSTLAEVAGGHVAVSSPAVFVVGQVVRLRDKLKP